MYTLTDTLLLHADRIGVSTHTHELDCELQTKLMVIDKTKLSAVALSFQRGLELLVFFFR